ncbi:MAG: hypothetical protein ACJ0SM_09015 [Arenicellales bacterium]
MDMRQPFNKANHSSTALVSSCILTFTVIVFSALHKGPIFGGDTQQYIAWSNLLISNSFDLLEYYSQNTFWTPAYFYTTMVLILSAVRNIFPEHWQAVFLGFNLLSILTIYWCIYTLRKKVTYLVWPLAIAPFLFLMGDSMVWPSYVLTDTYFAALVMLGLTVVLHKGLSIRSYALFFVVILLALSRPTSPIIIASFLLIAALKKKDACHFLYDNIKFIVSLTIILAALGFAFLISNTGITNAPLEEFRLRAFAGEVIRGRPETWLTPSSNFIDLVFLFFKRFSSFFQLWVADFSLIHNLINSFFVTFFIVCSFCFILGRSELNKPALTQYQLMLFLFVLLGALFHSATIIDYDWRYRFPYVAPMALFSAITFEQIVFYLRGKGS